jgi:hypothetical protein
MTAGIEEKGEFEIEKRDSRCCFWFRSRRDKDVSL